MKRLTKRQTERRAALAARLDAATQEVYNAAPDRNTRFSQCAKMASAETLAYYQECRFALIDYENTLINEGRAYRTPSGLFRSN